MILFIKKWWLLENLRKEINRHTGFQSLEDVSLGREVLLSPQFFIAGRKDLPEYPGLAEKFLWWKKEYNEEKLKRRIKEYNDIFKVCVEECCIIMKETQKEGKIMYMPSTATVKAHKISGYIGLLQGLLKEYFYTWSLILIPLFLGIYGSSFLKQAVEWLWNKLILIIF
jgi:cobalamin biosynthesis Co2+ chelatase CbiK